PAAGALHALLRLGRRAVRRALPAIGVALAAACSLRAPRVTEAVCNTDAQCRGGQVCFANECRAPASALQSVVVEITPPASSPYAPVQRALDPKTSTVATVDLP